MYCRKEPGEEERSSRRLGFVHIHRRTAVEKNAGVLERTICVRQGKFNDDFAANAFEVDKVGNVANAFCSSIAISRNGEQVQTKVVHRRSRTVECAKLKWEVLISKRLELVEKRAKVD